MYGYATGRGEDKDIRVGAVIVFRPGTDLAKAQKFLDELAKRGIIDTSQSSGAREYDANYGGPVWYTP